MVVSYITALLQLLFCHLNRLWYFCYLQLQSQGQCKEMLFEWLLHPRCTSEMYISTLYYSIILVYMDLKRVAHYNYLFMLLCIINDYACYVFYLLKINKSQYIWGFLPRSLLNIGYCISNSPVRSIFF